MKIIFIWITNVDLPPPPTKLKNLRWPQHVCDCLKYLDGVLKWLIFRSLLNICKSHHVNFSWDLKWAVQYRNSLASYPLWSPNEVNQAMLSLVLAVLLRGLHHTVKLEGWLVFQGKAGHLHLLKLERCFLKHASQDQVQIPRPQGSPCFVLITEAKIVIITRLPGAVPQPLL